MELTASKIVVFHVRWPRVKTAATTVTRTDPSLNRVESPVDSVVSAGNKTTADRPRGKTVRGFMARWIPVADASTNDSASGSPLLKGVVMSDGAGAEKTSDVELADSKLMVAEDGFSQSGTRSGSSSPNRWGKRRSSDGDSHSWMQIAKDKAEARALLGNTINSDSVNQIANVLAAEAEKQEACQEVNTMLASKQPVLPEIVGKTAEQQPKVAVAAPRVAAKVARTLQGKKAKEAKPKGGSKSDNKSSTLSDNKSGSKSTTLPETRGHPKVDAAEAKNESGGGDSPGLRLAKTNVTKKSKPARPAAPQPKAAEENADKLMVKTPVPTVEVGAVTKTGDVVIDVGDTGKLACKRFALDGKCRYGASCKFSHDGPSAAKPCRDFKTSGTCKYAKCRFSHDAPPAEVAVVLDPMPVPAPQNEPSKVSGPPPPEEVERPGAFVSLQYIVIDRLSPQLVPDAKNFSGAANMRSMFIDWQIRLFGSDVDGNSMSSDSRVGTIVVPSEVFHGYVSMYCATAVFKAGDADKVVTLRSMAGANARRMPKETRYSKIIYKAVGHEGNDPPLNTQEEWLAAWMDAAAYYQIVTFPRLQSTQSVALQRQLLSNAAIASYNSLRPVSTCDCIRSAFSSCLCGLAGLLVAGVVSFGSWVCETGGRLSGSPKRPAAGQTPADRTRADKKVRLNMTVVYDSLDTYEIDDDQLFCATKPQSWNAAFSRLMSDSAGGYKPDAVSGDMIITNRTSGFGTIAHMMGGVPFKRDYRPGSVVESEGKEPIINLELLIDKSHSGPQVGRNLPKNRKNPKFNSEKQEARHLRGLEWDGEDHFRAEVKDESHISTADRDGLSLVGIGWMSAIPVVPRDDVYNYAGIITRHYGNPNDICACLQTDRHVCPSCTLWRRNVALVEFIYKDIEERWRATSRYQPLDGPEPRVGNNGYQPLDVAVAYHPVDDVNFSDPAECLTGLPAGKYVKELVEKLDRELLTFGPIDARHSEATRHERWWYWYSKLRPEQKRLYMEDAHLTLTNTYRTGADPKVQFGSLIYMKIEKFVLFSPEGVNKDEPTNKYPRGICPAYKAQANAVTGPPNSHIKAKLVNPFRQWVESQGHLVGLPVPLVCMASGFTGSQCGGWMQAQIQYAEANGVNVLFLEGDMSRCDSSQNWGFVTEAGKVMLRLLDEPTEDEVCSIETLKRRNIYTRFGDFELVGATTSGVGSTTNGNTIGVNINGLYGSILSARNGYEGRRRNAPPHPVNLLALGDDSLVALFDIDEHEASYVRETVTRDLKTMGMIPKLILPYAPSFCSQLFYPIVINGRETYTMGPEICRWMARHGWTTKFRKDNKVFNGADCAALNKGLALSNPHWAALPVMRVVHKHYVALDTKGDFGLIDEFHGKIASQEDNKLAYTMSSHAVSFVLRVYGITTDELLALESLIRAALRAANGGCVMINSTVLDQMTLHLDKTRGNIA